MIIELNETEGKAIVKIDTQNLHNLFELIAFKAFEFKPEYINEQLRKEFGLLSELVINYEYKFQGYHYEYSGEYDNQRIEGVNLTFTRTLEAK